MVQQLLLVILIFDVLLAHYPPFGSCLLNTQCHTFECVNMYYMRSYYLFLWLWALARLVWLLLPAQRIAYLRHLLRAERHNLKAVACDPNWVHEEWAAYISEYVLQVDGLVMLYFFECVAGQFAAAYLLYGIFEGCKKLSKKIIGREQLAGKTFEFASAQEAFLSASRISAGTQDCPQLLISDISTWEDHPQLLIASDARREISVPCTFLHGSGLSTSTWCSWKPLPGNRLRAKDSDFEMADSVLTISVLTT